MGLSTMEMLKKANIDMSKYIELKDDTLRRFQLELLKIADDIIEVCNENNICYQLSGGSCLGAIRHKGFIPWDDDMDINILGSHFDKFINCFTKKYGDKYWIHTVYTPNYGLTVSRIRLKGSILRIHQDVNNPEAGFFVDLFRLENVYDNSILRTVHGIFCMGFGLMLSCRKFYEDRDIMMELANKDRNLERTFKKKIFIGRMISFLTVKKWAVLTQKCYGFCKNNQSKFLSIPAGRKHYFGEMYLRKDMQNTVLAEFEGRKWKIAEGWKIYLEKLYGDFMRIPPEDQREKHYLLELKFPENKD